MMRLDGQKNIGNRMTKDLFDVLERIRFVVYNKPHIIHNIMDSYRNNQYNSKTHLVSTIESLGIFDEVDNVVVLACWYGTVLFPLLSKHCDSITGYDMDANCANVNKARPIGNAVIKTRNIWLHELSALNNADLIINTSCEHMPPMKYWNKWDQIQPGTFVAFQSNDMLGIKDHVNCVKSLSEFKDQMPSNLEIISATVSEIEHEHSEKNNDRRFTIIGQI